jgi:hypothetical protein
VEPRPEPRFDWFIAIDGDGEYIGTWRAERPPAELAAYWRLGIDEFIRSGFPHMEECRRVASEVLPALRAAIERERSA